jgi:hypothetical protein
MGQDSFNARWMVLESGKDFDPPACETGLVLLRRRANQDPTLERHFPEIPTGAKGPHARAFYNHMNRCPKCNEAGGRGMDTSLDIEIP